MTEDYIMLDEYQQKGLHALHDFAENAFLGYAPGHGADEEIQLLMSFKWLVMEYIELMFASSKPLSSMSEGDRYILYKKLEKDFKPNKE